MLATTERQTAGRRGVLIAPLVTLSLLVVAVLVVTLTGLVRGFDREATAREQALVANGFAGSLNETGAMVVPQVVWADAVRFLDNRFDPEWAKVNILNYLTETAGFDAIFVIDAQDRYLIGSTDARPATGSDFEDFARSAPELIAAVRAVEAKRDAARRIGGPDFVKAPVQSSAVVAVRGQTYILTASRVQPDFTDVRLKGANGPIVLAAMRLDSAYLQEFGARFLLSDLRLHQGGEPHAVQDAGVALQGPTGATIAHFDWTPERPGTAMAIRLIPWGLALAAILAVIAARAIRRSNRMAQGLITSEARAAHLAYHDALTSLANRVQFSDRLTRALAQMRRDKLPLAVLCIDLDRFKDINDTFGHAVGDELLKEAAMRMAAQCREADMLARLSGDEFAILARIESPRDASALAERLCKAFADPFQCGSTQLHIGCSVGVAIADKEPVEPAEFLRQADIALYRAKEDGRGRYCLFEREMDVAIKGRRALEDELRQALASEELTMHYQPKVDMRGRVTGLEALIRWHHAERGEIPPSYFVPIAEQSGLILELGRFALRRAFIDSKRWPGMRIAINVSANQLRDRAFVGQLTTLVREHGVRPEDFDLEITEGILLGDDPDTHSRLGELRAMGFCLALDDFGTGYSSLSYLHRYPIGKIKIDRSFIANLGIETEADAVVDAIVKLAKALGLGVIAEGVETAAQFEHLKSTGAIELQGYYFSEALEAGAVAELLGTSLVPKVQERRLVLVKG